uniref:ATP binding protein n=1 Tax=Arundo donax TaxID=35708 RepID=A0A0A9GMZ1_ARUDO
MRAVTPTPSSPRSSSPSTCSAPKSLPSSSRWSWLKPTLAIHLKATL